ncbi:MAG: cytochrome P450 [Pseudomonadota bacterium]
MQNLVRLDPQKPLKLTDKHFINHRFDYYAHLREQLPVHQAKIMGMGVYVVSRYEDCLMITKDKRFVRDRSTATGGSKFPFPVPKNISFLINSMIISDDPEHKRLRSLVQKAFAPKSLRHLEENLRTYCRDLLQPLRAQGEFDFQQAYALQVPSKMIADMLGIDADEDMQVFRKTMRVLSEGMSGWSIMRTMFWDLAKSVRFVRELIERKRQAPGDDILTSLLEAEENGDQLNEEELVSMVFLLIVAGYETTVHLISNGLLALLDHPEQMQRLRDEPQLMGSAVEEMLRFCGPIHGTKMNYALEDIEIRGVRIPKGSAVMPLLGSANRDGAEFENPDVFDIGRSDNKHLAFSQGNHFCLGAFLARMETRVAFEELLNEAASIELAIPRQQLEVQNLPGWYRHMSMPVRVS